MGVTPAPKVELERTSDGDVVVKNAVVLPLDFSNLEEQVFENCFKINVELLNLIVFIISDNKCFNEFEIKKICSLWKYSRDIHNLHQRLIGS